MGLSVQTVAATHAPDHGRGDAFGIRHRFVGRHVVGQIVFVDAPEGSRNVRRPVPAPSQLLQ
jgi:hypothetical protein